jgi:outer membrane cobalamin receptor
MGATVSFESSRWLLKENFEYTTSVDYIYKNQFIPYLAELENITSVEYNVELIKVQLSVHYIGECENEMRNTIDDVLLLNFYSSYRFQENIQVLFEIENLLDARYKQFSNVPRERLQFNLGVRMAF